MHNYKNKTTDDFWDEYENLPNDVKKSADEAYKIFKENPDHPGLNFERLSSKDKLFSVRLNRGYRAYAKEIEHGLLKWYMINIHDYVEAIRRGKYV